jgi:hypothetical protein
MTSKPHLVRDIILHRSRAWRAKSAASLSRNSKKTAKLIVTILSRNQGRKAQVVSTVDEKGLACDMSGRVRAEENHTVSNVFRA